jgi:Tol biopolymer transport system component
MTARFVLLSLLLLLALAAPSGDVLAGKGERRITSGSAPSVSPDGEWLAFVRVSQGNADVWVSRLDGSETHRLTSHEARDASPDWSPDGTRIVFSSTRSGGSDLYVRAADGTGEALRLTRLEGREDDPAWSPDGTTIAFTALQPGGATIGFVPAEGGEVSLVTLRGFLKGEIADPSWAPDGKRLAVVTDRDGEYDLAVFEPGAESRLDLVTIQMHGSSELEPAWHPDRNLMAFSSDLKEEDLPGFLDDNPGPATPGQNEIDLDPSPDQAPLRLIHITSGASSSGIRRVSLPTYEASSPDWTPDGTALVFVRGRSVVPHARQPKEAEIWIREKVLKAKKDKKKKAGGKGEETSP